jgi:hypothetical protein
MHYLSEEMPNGYIYEGIIIDTGLDIYNYQNTASTISELKNMLRNKMESRPTDIYLRLKNDITEAKMSDALADIENYPYVTRVKYYFPMKTDSTGNYNILHAVITYDRIPDRITTDLQPEIYNIDDTVSYKVFAVYGSRKEDITDYVMIHPYGNFINIDEGVMTFSDAGGQDIEFEYGGKTAEVNVTAVNSKGLQYLATAKSSNPVNVKVFDRYIDFSLLNQWPFIENGRTLVPLRAVFEVLNCDVEWDPNIQSAIVEHGSTRIVIPAGMTTAYINGTAVSLDVPAKIVNDRIMVPLRFISEAIEKTVIWDGANSTVLIY